MISSRLFSLPGSTLLPNIWDILALLLVISVIIALSWTGSHMSAPYHLGQVIPISLNPNHLPEYAAKTTLRMFIALGISTVFSLAVGTLAAKSKRAGQIIIPLLDILQSVPILGYLSIAVVGFIALFPDSMWGPECACIFAVFTSQVWNMTLSFYQSMITVPNELNEATHVYQLSPWQRFWRLEVPFAMPGLLWNAMMSMSGGWFFVVAAEAISVANQSITLPGVGSYIAMAITHKDVHAIVYAIIAMLIVILLYDQLFFRPLLKWAEKFKLTDIPDEHSNSWVLTILKRTRVLQRVGRAYSNMMNAFINVSLFKTQGKPMARPKTTSRTRRVIANSAWYAIVLLIIIASLGFMAHFIFKTIPFRSTLHVIELGAFTCTRVFVLILLCSILWVPVGVWMGMRPKAAQFFQPIAQFLAAFPANLLFPIVVIAILKYHLNIEIWTAPLMILGTQWYILFNVIAGASTIPKELKLAAQNMQLSGWVKWKRFLFPAIFPYYITGAITAAGGAWNASVVAEVIHWGHTTLKAQGLGAYIAENTTSGHFPQVALGIVVMCLFVVIINIVFWRKLYHYANTRFAMN